MGHSVAWNDQTKSLFMKEVYFEMNQNLIAVVSEVAAPILLFKTKSNEMTNNDYFPLASWENHQATDRGGGH